MTGRFCLSFSSDRYYAGSIFRRSLRRTAMTDRHLWIEVAEYLFAVVGAVALVWLIADELVSPLWGGLTSIRLR